MLKMYKETGMTRPKEPKELTHRFVRINPRFDVDDTLNLLKDEMKKFSGADHIEPIPITWIEKFGLEMQTRNECTPPTTFERKLYFYSLPGSFPLQRSLCYQEGRVYGMDISSGAAVAALLTNDWNSAAPVKVLDLCCAPGQKLCMIVDMLEQCHQKRYGERKLSISMPTNLSLQHHIVGVDLIASRISICKNVLEKYFIDSCTSGRSYRSEKERPTSKNSYPNETTRIQLFCGDGTTFGLSQNAGQKDKALGDSSPSSDAISTQQIVPLELLHKDQFVWDSFCAVEEEFELNSKAAVGEKRKRKNKSARSRERQRLLKVSSNAAIEGKTTCEYNVNLFDRVLVDAECSSDGAVRHLEHKLLRKRNHDQQHESELANATVSDKMACEGDRTCLVNLQKRLIGSGFRLLKPGGIMVYSTCSLSKHQNEDVVNYLLKKESSSASILTVAIPSIEDKVRDLTSFIEEGNIPGTVRFKPSAFSQDSSVSKHFGGGFFLARIQKRPLNIRDTL